MGLVQQVLIWTWGRMSCGRPLSQKSIDSPLLINGLHRQGESTRCGLPSPWIQKNIGVDKKVVIVAHNGVACNMKWIGCLTQTSNVSNQLAYVTDRSKMTRKWKLCKLNPKKGKLEPHSLGSVWTYINGGGSLGAHDSLVNTFILHNEYIAFINWTESFTSFRNIRSTSQLGESQR